MTGMFDWEEGDRFSFEDSDRFEEDSLCSWISEPESLCNNWRGWKKNSSVSDRANGGSNGNQAAGAGGSGGAGGVGGEPRAGGASSASVIATGASTSNHHSSSTTAAAAAVTSRSRVEEGQVLSLVELAAKEVACHIPFEVVEHVYPPVPEQLQLRIACWSFPENEEDIRLYSCLANGSADEFIRGEHIFKGRGVKDPLQIGFHLSATVVPPGTLAQSKGSYNVAVTFDRRRITSCNCTCSSSASWCAHVVAVCLHRIHQSNQVCLRAPVSESLSRLRRDQLQKFAQYLISELPQQILPTAQRLLDELLSCQQTAINTVCGAPDPTAGASCSEQTTWCLDEATLHGNIRKILIKFCVPSPIVFSDVNYLSSTAPPAAAEWSSLLRPLRGREPEGMWNLLSIVREMYRRNDRNAMLLLEILTEECLACEQILVWWFNTRVSLHNGNLGGRGGINSNTHASQHACSSLCDELVVLWRLAALNPALSPPERKILSTRLKDWHLKTIEKVCKAKGGSNNNNNNNNNGGVVGGGGVGVVNGNGNNGGVRKADIDIFAGFKSAIEACLLDWGDYSIQGVTYAEGVASRYYLPYCSGRHQESHVREVSSSSAVISGEHQPAGCTTIAPNMKHTRTVGITHCHRGTVSPHNHHPSRDVRITSAPMIIDAGLGASTDGNRSSISSEGFCENEAEGPSSDFVEEFFPSAGPITNTALAEAMKFVFAEKGQTKATTDADILEAASVDSSSSSTSEKAFGVSLELESLHPIDLLTGHGNDAASMASTPQTTSSTGTATVIASAAIPKDDGGVKNPADEDLEKLSPDDTDSDLSSAPDSEHNKPIASMNTDPRSESQQSSDENHPSQPDAKAKSATIERQSKDRKPQQQQPSQQQPPPTEQTTVAPEENSIFASIKRKEDPMEVLFARAEALHAHGHTREACKLGVKLAEELLANPPDLMIELPPLPTKGKRKKKVNPASHQISCLASATLAKAAFLCTVLSENAEHTHVAFKVGLYGLEMARPPASTKALEVKLANQESDLVALLKRIPLGQAELRVLREKAEMLRDGKLTSRGDALLPMNLTSFIFDALCLSNSGVRGANGNGGYRLPTDEVLGFEAAVAALGLKANVSEADHPLLCEGTRRQRGDLALTLLVHYKDDQEKLAKHIMDKLLDKEIHQMYKAPVLSVYYASKLTASHGMNNGKVTGGQSVGSSSSNGTNGGKKEATGSVESDDVGKPGTFCSSSNSTSSSTIGLTCVEDGTSPDIEKSMVNMGPNVNQSTVAAAAAAAGGARSKESLCYQGRQRRGADDKRDDTSSPTWEEDYKAWEAKFRCTNFRTHKKHSAGMASIDSSAPETTSSDNSPTLIRRTGWGKPVGPGSDSGSSGKSSDSFGSSSSGDKTGRIKTRENDSPPGISSIVRCQNQFGTEMAVRSVTTCVKTTRFKGKRSYPSIPNQPSEASAHFMFELAKTVLAKAGGNSSTSLFTQPTTSQNHRGPHRPLHICAFQIGLYALGLHNRVSPNWLSRTYSSHVSWITSQALEIGSAAISFLIDTWEGHLTPPEVASLADRASRGRDPNMVGTASELALSCLPHAHALNPNEIQRAITQCKEQNNEMLERACLAVESAAKGGGVYPDALFDVAHKWYELYKETVTDAVAAAQVGRDLIQQQPAAAAASHRMSEPILPPKVDRSNGIIAVNGQNMSPPSMAIASCSNQDGNRLPSSGGSSATASPDAPNLDPAAASIAFVPCHQPEVNLMQQQQQHQPPSLPTVISQVPVTLTVAHNLPYGPPSISNAMGMPFATACAIPYSYIPNFAPHYNHHHHHQQQQHQPQHLPMQPPLPPHIHPFVSGPFPYSQQPTFSIPAQSYYALPTVTVASQMRPPPMYANHQLPTLQNGQQRPGLFQSQGGVAQNGLHTFQNAQQGQCGHPQQQATAASQVRTVVTPINPNQLNYLLSTYRVGMLALEMLARRVHDDRPNAKYARNPSYGEDVKWLLNVAKKLGTSYVQQFCICTVGSVASPFLLQEITWDAAQYLARNNPAPLAQHLRSPVLTPLVQKCQQMYIQCTHMKMFHLTPTEYEDFVGIIQGARTAFQMTPGGMVQFNEFLQALRRSKTCKKDLWQRIATALQSGSV